MRWIRIDGTLAAARLAGIRFMSTGGMGGVHRGFAKTLEILRRKDILESFSVSPHFDFFSLWFLWGFGLWVPHAVLACTYRKMRQTRGMATAVVGTVVFFFGLTEIAPLLTGIPALLTGIVLSLAAVWLFVDCVAICRLR